MQQFPGFDQLVSSRHLGCSKSENGLTSYMLSYRGNRLVPLIPRLLRLTYHDLRERGGGGGEGEHMCPGSKVEKGARPISLTLIDTKPARHARLRSLSLSPFSLAHTNTFSPLLLLTHILALSPLLSLSHTHTLSLFFLSLSNAATHTNTHTDSRSFFLSQRHRHRRAHKHTHTHTHTLALALVLSLSLCLS